MRGLALTVIYLTIEPVGVGPEGPSRPEGSPIPSISSFGFVSTLREILIKKK